MLYNLKYYDQYAMLYNHKFLDLGKSAFDIKIKAQSPKSSLSGSTQIVLLFSNVFLFLLTLQ